MGGELEEQVESQDEEEEEAEEDGEEWGGVEAAGSAMQVDQRPAGSKPVKPPTAEEMRAIREATDLYRSSSFKLQVRTMLSDIE
jgi:U3 small nucleolar RNA-associated protein 22